MYQWVISEQHVCYRRNAANLALRQVAGRSRVRALQMQRPRFRAADHVAILAIALVARLLILWFAIAQFGPTWLFTRGIELGTLA